MQGWWMYNWYQVDPLMLFSWVFWVIFSICLHELGHGVAAIRCGDDTPRLSGHMTFNPLVHIPPRAWIMFLLTGLTWGLMPVNPSRFRRTTDDAFVSAAGPAMNVLQAVVILLLAGLWRASLGRMVDPTVAHNVAGFLRVGIAVNIASVPFNLLPVPPLDGSRILAVFSRGYRQLISTPQAQMGGMIVLMFMLFTVGSFLYPISFAATDAATKWVVGLLRALSP